MVEITGIYEGEKHCMLTHGPSKNIIHTDAPIDNNGRGEAFSPTDLLAAAFGSCLMTVMAIYGDKNNIELRGSTFKVIKTMKVSPRRIEQLEVSITLPDSLSAAQRDTMEKVALSCPVKLSLNQDVLMPINFHYRTI